MLKQKGGFLQSYTSALYGIALYAQKHGIEVNPKFDGILTTAETLFPHQRRAIEEVFGPVYDGYGSHEILGIAYQCQERNGYHLIDPNVIFETEEFTGDLREIVITDLWNYAFPFIRYRIGDLMSGEMGPCSCGCTWRKIARIEGRVTDSLFTPQGGIFPITAIGFRVMKPYCPPIQQYQLAKVADNKVVLRLQIKENEHLDLDMIKSLMEPNFKDIWQLEVVRVDKFDVGPSGKHKVIVDETV
jgi:phenylacetate-CoA ligase